MQYFSICNNMVIIIIIAGDTQKWKMATIIKDNGLSDSSGQYNHT